MANPQLLERKGIFIIYSGTEVRLANLKEISPTVHLPKTYMKQLDGDSEFLMKKFYTVILERDFIDS